jgi:hypothetical protein
VSDHPPPLAPSTGALTGAGSGYAEAVTAGSISLRALARQLWRSHPTLMALGLVGAFCAIRLTIYALLAQSFGGLTHGICNYDCPWYEQTARYGYDVTPRGDLSSNVANWAFFPLYPLLLGAFSGLVPAGEGFTWVGILLSTACFAGFAMLGAVYLQHKRFGALLTWFAFVSLWPGAVYFAFPYSEALYALVMTAALLTLSRHSVMGSAWCCAALTATRPTGLLMLPLILVDRLAFLRRAWVDGLLRRQPAGVLSQAILPLAIAPLGLIAYMAYLRWHMGDGLAFLHVQAAWQRHSLPPWTFLWEGLTAYDWTRILKHPAEESLSVQALVGCAALALAIRQVFARRYAEAWLIGASVLLASSAGLQSIPRFVLTNPVVILVLFRMAVTGASTRRLWVIGIGLGLLQIGLAVAWFVGAPVLA